jgi:hypothetical protein
MRTRNTYRKSSYSSPQQSCVELAVEPDRTSIRDSKRPSAGGLTIPAPAFTHFLTTLKIHG